MRHSLGGTLRVVIALLLVFLAACSGDADAEDATQDQSPGAPFRGPAINFHACETPPPAAPLPDDFPEMDFPSGSVSVEPRVDLSNGVRADLYVPLTVKETMLFFKSTLKESGRRIIATDYEGFEAEVYFAERGENPGLVRMLVGCGDGTNVSIEIFEPA